MSVDFPDEILDMIFAALGDLSLGDPFDKCQDQRNDTKSFLSACSLVCKRWNNIALPYLFRSLMLAYSGPGEKVDPTAQYFARTPQIAKRVQAVYLANHKICADELETLPQALPSLQHLKLEHVNVWNGSVNVDNSLLRRSGDHTIEKLEFKDDLFGPFEQCASIVNLLSLFTEIGELCIEVDDTADSEDERPTTDDVETFAVSTAIGHVRIRKLKCGRESVGGFFVPSYLLRVGALDSLTHLTFRLEYDTEWDSFFNLVSAIGSTLTGLCIETGYNCFTDLGAVYDIAAMKNSLSTCDFLEEIRIVLTLRHAVGILKYIRHPDGKQLCCPFRGHEASWLAAVRILGLVSTNCLRKASLSLQGTSIDAHILAWDQFRAWCSDAPRLAEVKVELEQAFDQRPCLAYEMQDFKNLFTPTFMVPHGDSIAVLETLPVHQIRTYECQHDGCRRFQAERNVRD